MTLVNVKAYILDLKSRWKYSSRFADIRRIKSWMDCKCQLITLRTLNRIIIFSKGIPDAQVPECRIGRTHLITLLKAYTCMCVYVCYYMHCGMSRYMILRMSILIWYFHVECSAAISLRPLCGRWRMTCNLHFTSGKLSVLHFQGISDYLPLGDHYPCRWENPWTVHMWKPQPG